MELEEAERLRRRVAGLEKIVEERGLIVEEALRRIADLTSKAEQTRAEMEILEKVCAERMRLVKTVVKTARERERSIVALTKENAMLAETAREREQSLVDLAKERAMLAETVDERKRNIDALSKENAMLIETARERADIIARLEQHVRESALRYRVGRLLRVSLPFLGRRYDRLEPVAERVERR